MSSHSIAKRALSQVVAASSRTSAVRPSRRAAYALRCRTRSSNSAVSYPIRQSLDTARCSSRNYSSIAPQQGTTIPIPQISDRDTYDIVIIGAGNAGLALACTLRTHLFPIFYAYLDRKLILPWYLDSTVSKPALMRDDTRILLVEGGSLDRVRSWSGKGEWENRVSSLTAENVQFLRGMINGFLLGMRIMRWS